MLSYRPNPKKAISDRRGFTLVELLVVIAIILILSGIVFGLTRGISGKQARSRAQSEVNAIGIALENYKLRYGDYPWLGTSSGAELYQHLTGQKKMVPTSTAGSPNVGATGDNKTFLDPDKMSVSGSGDSAYFQDPWGNAYIYYYKNSSNYETWEYPGFILMSKGPDGATSTSGLTTGKLSADHFDTEENIDNVIYGFEF